MQQLPPEAGDGTPDLPAGEEWPGADEVLSHFYMNVYPEIEQKYHPEKGGIQEKTAGSLLEVLGYFSSSKSKASSLPSERSYDRLALERAKGITDFILGKFPQDIRRIQLLLEAMRSDMMSVAYGNVRLEYNHAAKRYAENGQRIKESIITKCLELCSKKFWNSVVTLRVTDHFLIVTGKDGTTLHPRDKNDASDE